MTEAEQAIADLDESLAETGQTIELWRQTGTQLIPVKVKLKASVRPLAVEELIGNLKQGSSRVVISPTEIERTGWPGPLSSTSNERALDRRVPKQNDKAVIGGKTRNVEVVRPIYMADALVRIELDVLG